MSNINKIQHIPGTRFGRWMVLDHEPVRKNAYILWFCECDCGTERAVRPDRLRSGESQSCGCLHREIVRNNVGAPTHGLSKTPEYRAWSQAKQRCRNPRHHRWAGYGGRGISVADEWVDDFEAFYEHVGPRPSKEHSLGRIDNDGNYEPGNVEWQTSSVQNANRRKSLQRSAPGSGANGEFFWRGKWRPL